VESTQAPWRRTGVLLLALALALPALPASSQSQEPAASQPAPSQADSKTPAPPKQVKKVDINNATLSELRALPLGESEAKKVIAHRPYKARGELMTKAGLPEGVYFAVKDKLEVQAPRKPAPKK